MSVVSDSASRSGTNRPKITLVSPKFKEYMISLWSQTGVGFSELITDGELDAWKASESAAECEESSYA